MLDERSIRRVWGARLRVVVCWPGLKARSQAKPGHGFRAKARPTTWLLMAYGSGLVLEKPKAMAWAMAANANESGLWTWLPNLFRLRDIHQGECSCDIIWVNDVSCQYSPCLNSPTSTSMTIPHLQLDLVSLSHMVQIAWVRLCITPGLDLTSRRPIQWCRLCIHHGAHRVELESTLVPPRAIAQGVPPLFK